ncbi:hypothetical protein MRI28_31620 [Nocardiopsis dassonvillei]|uniref:hypothetical protein n=1 Tax=Nocardiopsis dassonvillei TaxID=2014 RepID=UPI00200BA938|nr:hypothetical protein [Nocardiopsis dassonvillei]MCK9874118.1 hypothetical protein [Nocardiopsis dassonvillei]
MSVDVPMPPSIRRLPLTRAGYPVPAVSPRGDMTDTFDIVDLPQTGLTAVCPCEDVRQPYKLGAMCPDKQRRTMRRGRCGVCGRHIDPRTGLLFVRLDTTTDIWVEPPLHPRCMAYSLQACPVLAKETAAHGEVLLCHRVELRERRETLGPHRDGRLHYRYFPLGDPDARRFGALGYLAARPVNPTVHPAPYWREHLAPALT